MKINLVILSVLGLILFSCKSEIDTLISVQLNPTFLILSEGNDEPMKMKSANADTVQVYAIQVYENDAPYYYGLFTDVSKMQIALTTSKTYKFKVAAYKAGTGKGLKTLTDADGVNYYLPTKLAIKNAFIKGDLLKDIDSPTTLNLNGQQKDFAEVDAFYATKSVTVEKGTTTIDFSLLRMGFGINFTVDALTSGNMEIYLGNDTIKLNSTKTTAITVRQFNKTTNNFTDIHSKAETFGDSIAISAKWISTSGTTVTASGKYKFLRNYQKTINIQLNTITNSFNFEGWGNIPTNGLVAWYPFNGNVNDESGNGNNGIIMGTLSLSNDRFGISNSSYSFTGNGCVKLPSINLPSFSLSVWVKKTGTDGNIICKHYSSSFNSSYLLYAATDALNNPSIYYTSASSVAYSTKTNSSWSDGKWHMITATLSSTYLTIYFDGVLQTQITGGTAKSTTFSTLIGGQYSSSGVIVNMNVGSIDDVGFWNRDLTQSEITALYNAR